MTTTPTPEPRRIYDPRPDDPTPDHPFLWSGITFSGLCVAARSAEHSSEVCDRPQRVHAPGEA